MGKIKQWIVDAWNYSRIIFINVVGALLASSNEIIGFLMGVDYDAFFRHSVSVLISLVVNLISVILRMQTDALPGARHSRRRFEEDDEV